MKKAETVPSLDVQKHVTSQTTNLAFSLNLFSLITVKAVPPDCCGFSQMAQRWQWTRRFTLWLEKGGLGHVKSMPAN